MHNVPWATNDVVSLGVRATIRSRFVEVVSVDNITRELPRTLPGSSVSSGGVAAATGKMVIAPEKRVLDRVPTPWTDSTYPRVGDPVKIWVSHDDNEVLVFTGIVEKVTGSTDSPEVSVEVVDYFYKLNTEFSHRPLARMMPPLSTIGDGRQRMTGLLSTWVTDLAARSAGFYATPPMDGYCLVSAPLQGSTWPERGELRNSYRSDNVGIWHKYHPGAVTESEGWISMSHLYAEYEPDKYNTPYNSGITTARPLNLTMMAGRTQSSSSYVAARWGNGYTLRVSCTGSRAISAQAIDSDGNITNVAHINASDAGPWITVTARFRPTGQNSLAADITTDTGVSVTGAITPPSGSSVFTDPISQVRVYAPQGCYLAGVQASFTSLPTAAVTWSRTACIRPATPLRTMTLTPAIVSKSSADILKEQAAAEMSAVWIDEFGVLQYRDRRTLLSGSVVSSVRSGKNLQGLEWYSETRDIRRRVTVKYRDARVSIARRSSLVAYEGSAEEFHDGEDQEWWIEPDSDEEWIAVDSTPRYVYGGEGHIAFNSGEGTFLGYTGLDSSGDEISILNRSASGFDVSLDLELVGARTWKVTMTVGSLGSQADRIVTRSRSEGSTYIKPRYQGLGLPLLRCMGKGKWVDQSVSTSVTGPEWANDFSHDAKWYVQSYSEATSLARSIAAYLANPNPVFDSVPVRADPRIQIGDKLQVLDEDVTGLALLGVVYSIRQSIDPEDHTMELGLLVTSATASFPTLEEFDQWYSGMSLTQFDSLMSGLTLTEIENNPLR